MRAFYIPAITISSRVVGDDDTFGSICEFDGRAFRGCCAMGASVDHHKVMPPFPSDQRQHMIACYYSFDASPVFATTYLMLGDEFVVHIGGQSVSIR